MPRNRLKFVNASYLSMDTLFLDQLLLELQARGGGMVIGDNDQFKAVVLSLEKYNELLLQSGKVVDDIITKVTAQTVLVTGGAGYIGSHCVRQLLSTGHKVIVLDNLSSGKRDNIPEEAIFIEGDYGDLDLLAELFSREEVNSVIHFAASILVQESLQNPNDYFTNNILKTTHLLAAMNEFGIKRILFSSTAGVYGPSNEVLKETSPTNPINPYSAGKLAVEELLKYQAMWCGWTVTVMRSFNAAGSDVEALIRPAVAASITWRLMDVALGKSDKFVVFGRGHATRDGTTVRDYVHVTDIAHAFVLALDSVQEEPFEVYNVGSGEGTSITQLIDSAVEVTSRMIPIEYVEAVSGDIPLSYADITKIRNKLGFEPSNSSLEKIFKTSWHAAKHQ